MFDRRLESYDSSLVVDLEEAQNSNLVPSSVLGFTKTTPVSIPNLSHILQVSDFSILVSQCVVLTSSRFETVLKPIKQHKFK